MIEISPLLLLAVSIIYFGILILIAKLTTKNAQNSDFFIGNKESNWVFVAIGMIGTSLSGVTFISIPGVVGAGGINQSFAYMQMVLGYLVGYFIIATVLMPIYYRYNLTSIYTFLEKRLGFYSYKTGASFFLLSRLLGSSLRLYLVTMVIQTFILDAFGVPFWINVLVTLGLIWAYSYKGGIKTIVITDMLQTFAMLLAVILTIFFIANQMNFGLLDIVKNISTSEYSQVFFFDGGWNDPNNFYKQFISGALIAVVMTGLDQDMMQKNLSCRNLKDAQKNMFTFSIILVFANLLFLSLGALLYLYANQIGLTVEKSDLLYPTIALKHLPLAAGIIFFIGLIAAAYSSADSAMTALTTSFCIDFLNFEKGDLDQSDYSNIKNIVHLGVSFLIFLLVLFFYSLNSDAVINYLFKIANYTYGPLLGLFAFAIGTRTRGVLDKWVPLVCIAAPLISYYIDSNSKAILGDFSFGNLIIALNGLLTFTGLWLLSYKLSSNDHRANF